MLSPASSKSSESKTHILVINAVAKLVSDFHRGASSPYSRPLLGDRTKIRAISQVYEQQRSIGKDALIRGFIVRNWMIVQNICEGKDNLEHKNLGWMKKVIRLLWTYSHEMWVGRCKQVHESTKGAIDSMNHQELLYCIRQSLKIPREELSISEKKLHINISNGMRVAHTKTLARWVRLLKQERLRTIRHRGNGSAPGTRLQKITRFLKQRDGA